MEISIVWLRLIDFKVECSLLGLNVISSVKARF